jgi:hypothetical protein
VPREAIQLVVHVLGGEGHRCSVLGAVGGVPRPCHRGPSKGREVAIVNWGRDCRELGGWQPGRRRSSVPAHSAFMPRAATVEATHRVPTLCIGSIYLACVAGAPRCGESALMWPWWLGALKKLDPCTRGDATNALGAPWTNQLLPQLTKR